MVHKCRLATSNHIRRQYNRQQCLYNSSLKFEYMATQP